jgi:ring-1,2-phenylacetyl-CoA epoxidase subunit PaaD
VSAAGAPAESRQSADPLPMPDSGVRSGVHSGGVRTAAAWQALARVEDPEIPALSIVELGIVRFMEVRPDGVLGIGLSPTYTGCPATEHIELMVREALEAAGVGPFAVTRVLSPAWTSDWITPEGRRKLDEHGIVPPPAAASWARRASLEAIACPRCRSIRTECTSQFGSTPCKALHRCRDCLEPFESFKCL